ncbi:hypothetical protein KP509_36G006900 [Ceratopteris richardii]|uniref:Uncharacterized protein n=1 Tax=Ceratopteris richardii TaxID=49495 RepID=A0A8T2QAE6_CERRI|nr:hypothetical protein KP509_36G006900 [Ceratopteris richardii]
MSCMKLNTHISVIAAMSCRAIPVRCCFSVDAETTFTRVSLLSFFMYNDARSSLYSDLNDATNTEISIFSFCVATVGACVRLDVSCPSSFHELICVDSCVAKSGFSYVAASKDLTISICSIMHRSICLLIDVS